MDVKVGLVNQVDRTTVLWLTLKTVGALSIETYTRHIQLVGRGYKPTWDCGPLFV